MVASLNEGMAMKTHNGDNGSHDSYGRFAASSNNEETSTEAEGGRR